MDIRQSSQHDQLIATYQTLELARLNDVLTKCGIDQVEIRRRICEQYFFESGYFLDSCWFGEIGMRVRPGICFTELGAAGQAVALIVQPDNSETNLHEYAHGAGAWLFDDHIEDASEIETGDLTDTKTGNCS
jgi:hypothetical protein